MAASRTPMRRRQRSVRVTVAVVLLSVATAAVLATLPTRSAMWLSLSSVLALALAWASLRIMWTEVLQSRRENATDRAATASAYRNLFSLRAAEHAEFTSAMTERLAEAQLSQRELQGLVVAAETRAQGSEVKLTKTEGRLREETRRLVETQERVHHLEGELAVRRAEESDALATWEGDGGDSVHDLAQWDAQAATKARKNAELAKELKHA